VSDAELGLAIRDQRAATAPECSQSRIRKLADEHGFVLGDVEQLFHGQASHHRSPGSFVQVIEPNLGGATPIAVHWHDLLASSS
jgi:hypothetical protein